KMESMTVRLPSRMKTAPPCPSCQPWEQGGDAGGMGCVGVALPLTSRRCWRVRPKVLVIHPGLLKLRMRTALPPSGVFLLPPWMAVFLLVGTSSWAVTAMVKGAGPQSKVTTPPVFTAWLRAPKVQLAAVPVPTTVVGLEVSTGFPCAGTPALHDPLG